MKSLLLKISRCFAGLGAAARAIALASVPVWPHLDAAAAPEEIQRYLEDLSTRDADGNLHGDGNKARHEFQLKQLVVSSPVISNQPG